MVIDDRTTGNGTTHPISEPPRREGFGVAVIQEDGPTLLDALAEPKVPTHENGHAVVNAAPPLALTDAEIRNRLQAHRGDRSIREIALAVGLNAETVRRYFRGRSRVPAEFVARFAAAYRLEVAHLLIRGAGPPLPSALATVNRARGQLQQLRDQLGGAPRRRRSGAIQPPRNGASAAEKVEPQSPPAHHVEERA